LIRVDGEDWRPRAVEERKAKLAKVLGTNPDASLPDKMTQLAASARDPVLRCDVPSSPAYFT
jgi:hypothetical protein